MTVHEGYRRGLFGPLTLTLALLLGTSSARSACGRTVNLWEHTYQMGASLLINGYHSSLGVMNDQSSSWDTAN